MAPSKSTPLDVLDGVKPELARQGYGPTGPHPAVASESGYLTLRDGRYVYAEMDGEGCWQLLVYAGLRLTSIADPDGRDFPGDAVTQ